MDTEAAKSNAGAARAAPARVIVLLTGALTERSLADELDHNLPNLEASVAIVTAETGDPVAAASDALRQHPADEVLIAATAADRDLWLGGGELERARASLRVPVRLIGVDDDEPHLSAVGAAPAYLGRRLPRFSEGDLVAIALVLVGAIAGIAVLLILIIRLLG